MVVQLNFAAVGPRQSTSLSCFLSCFVGSCLAGCQHPRGTPATAETLSSTAEVAGAAWQMTPRSEKDRQKLPVGQGKTQGPSETRIEITATGIADCPQIIPSDIQYEILNKRDEPVIFGNLSSTGEGVTSALLMSNEAYTARFRAQRTGKLLSEKKLTFSGSAPWLVQVSLKDCFL